jgi:hypothetical protein
VVEYKRGVENRVADALSRKEGWEDDISLTMITIPIASWIEELKQQYAVDPELQQLMAKWQGNELDTRKFSLHDGLLFYKQKILLGQSPQLKAQVLQYVHNGPMAGHSGYDKTLQRAKRDFYWKGMRKEIKQSFELVMFVNKTSTKTPTLRAYSNPSLSLLGSGLTFRWTLWKGYPHPKAIQSFMVISPPSLIPTPQLKSPSSSSKLFSNSMAYPSPLSQTGTLRSLACFGGSSSGFRAHPLTSARATTRRPTVKRKW